ncbi:DUF4255 domain-containing protein [Leptolyngbya sp. FACHB-321]|uniref:DUF4255 domain-containing protein n=1 Tax=Leptolyngbya sp. FACHB-321 TaxID=2692807 RepID=UPI00168A1925|nr:DUF4255 domain-containing protein [Leptolyngbya sp. FACHB-321]MBD2037650.1 DUF4255 domain-containing protein [Leptolyngbya sp. FACHB-321]
MIHHLDDTLRELLHQKVPIDDTAIDIKFETPTSEWENKLTKPTINLFLYDIRENLGLRSNESSFVRNGAIGTETRAPVRIDCTYLITIWTKDIADEHRLLGTLLKVLLRYPTLPPEVLQGEMVSQSLPLRSWIAQPDRTPNVWDFWGPLDGRLKAGISCVVTLAAEPFPAVEVGLATETILRIGLTK